MNSFAVSAAFLFVGGDGFGPFYRVIHVPSLVLLFILEPFSRNRNRANKPAGLSSAIKCVCVKLEVRLL